MASKSKPNNGTHTAKPAKTTTSAKPGFIAPPKGYDKVGTGAVMKSTKGTKGTKK